MACVLPVKTKCCQAWTGAVKKKGSYGSWIQLFQLTSSDESLSLRDLAAG